MKILPSMTIQTPGFKHEMHIDPSAYQQFGWILVVIFLIAVLAKLMVIVFILIFLLLAVTVFAFSPFGRWSFSKGKLSRDIMQDGTGGSKERPIGDFQEGDIVEGKALPAPNKRLTKKAG